jgi:hypothetical protein
MSRKSPILFYLTLVFLSSVACVTLGPFGTDQRATSESLQVTVTAETSLTETHGVEVCDVIENFELQWGSLEAHRNPSVQSELAIGPFLHYWGYARMGEAIYDEPFWLVTTSATVKNVRVIEYSSERFRAVASVARRVDKTTTEGVIIESSLPRGHCEIYVFVRANNTWKLAGSFLTDGPPQDVERDWRDAPDWLKDIIGELPEGDLCEW